MKTTAKKLSDTRVEVKVTLDAADLAAAEKKAIEKLSKELRIEGFRKGKVPAEMAKKFIPANELNAETIDLAVRNTVLQAFAASEKSPLMIPNVNVTKYVPGEMAEYTATADIVPEIKLGDFKNLGVKMPKVEVLEKDITDILNNIATSFAEKVAVKRAAKESDEVIIDFVGKKDGEAFQGGTAKDYKLVLGSKTFIPGFEEGIIGHEAGDKFDLQLTFPKDYGVKALAGQKVVFETLLKQVNEVKNATIDDKLAEKCGPFKSLDELKADIKKNLGLQNEQRTLEKFKDELIDALVKKSKISAPEVLINDQFRLMKDDLSRNAATAKLTLEEYLEQAGETLANWEKQAKEVAEKRVKASLALQILARDQKITVADDIVEAKIAELRDVYKKSAEALKNLKDPNVKNDIKNRLTIEKTLEFLVNANKSEKSEKSEKSKK